MDFQLKTLDAAGAAREKCDALVLVVPEGYKPGKDPLSRLAANALKAGDDAVRAAVAATAEASYVYVTT